MTRAWLVLSYGDDRLYGGNAGYSDETTRSYEYDSFVPNHRQVSAGDVIVVCSKKKVEGAGLIDQVEESPHTKVFRRCPECRTAQSKRRMTTRPEYRCTNGHEFDVPVEDPVECIQYVANYGRLFTPARGLSIEEVRLACRRFNGQSSIQPIDAKKLSRFFVGADVELLNAINVSEVPAADKIPEGITREHLVWAIGQLRDGADHAFGRSTDYDVLFENSRFPPKAVVGVAAAMVTGSQLHPRDFSAGLGSKCFRCLEANGFEIVSKAAELPFPDEVPTGATFLEGSVRQIVVNKYEREAKARKACLKRHGTACKVCGFEFGQVFGALGEGFIHVHHVVPLAEIGEQYELDAVRDLVPVCPNCHAMLHKRVPPFSIADLQRVLSEQSPTTA